MTEKERERRANLLAALNDGPENLTGWPTKAPTIVNTLMGNLEVPGIRYRKLDQWWWEIKLVERAHNMTKVLGAINRLEK